MDRKFNPGDLVYKTSDETKKLYIVELYEPNHMVTVLNALAQENNVIPESAYDVTCYWMNGDEKVQVQFSEDELTKSSIR